jgi:hypothetical protein
MGGADKEMKKPEPVEPIVWLLAAMMLVFAGLILFCEHFFPMDGQIFTVFTGLLGNIAGAFLMRIKPKAASDPSDDPTKNVTTTITSTPKDKIPVPTVEVHNG